MLRALNDAAAARLESVWRAESVHRNNAVPPSPATPYDLVSVSSGRGITVRNCGTSGGKAYRLVVQAVGRTDNEVLFAAERADVAFDGHALVAAGVTTTPAESEVSSNIIRDPDAGALLSMTLTYTFAAYPTE